MILLSTAPRGFKRYGHYFYYYYNYSYYNYSYYNYYYYRWKKLESHDITVECAKLSLDLIEGRSEEDVKCPVRPASHCQQPKEEGWTRKNQAGGCSVGHVRHVVYRCSWVYAHASVRAGTYVHTCSCLIILGWWPTTVFPMHR